MLSEKNNFIQKQAGIWYNSLVTYSIKFNIDAEIVAALLHWMRFHLHSSRVSFTQFINGGDAAASRRSPFGETSEPDAGVGSVSHIGALDQVGNCGAHP